MSSRSESSSDQLDDNESITTTTPTTQNITCIMKSLTHEAISNDFYWFVYNHKYRLELFNTLASDEEAIGIEIRRMIRKCKIIKIIDNIDIDIMEIMSSSSINNTTDILASRLLSLEQLEQLEQSTTTCILTKQCINLLDELSNRLDVIDTSLDLIVDNTKPYLHCNNPGMLDWKCVVEIGRDICRRSGVYDEGYLSEECVDRLERRMRRVVSNDRTK